MAKNHIELQEMDLNLTPEQKADRGYNLNTVCGVCGNVCCSNCTANGNPGACSQTMFTMCNICGHASSSHGPG